MSTLKVLEEIEAERKRLDAKWGVQAHPDGTGQPADKDIADHFRKICDQNAKKGKLTWRDIANEELHEAFAETDAVKLRKELIQTAAVLTAWAEDIDKRLPTDYWKKTEENQE